MKELTKEKLDKILDEDFPLSTQPLPKDYLDDFKTRMTPKEKRQRTGFVSVGNFNPRIDEYGKKHCINCDKVLSGRRKRYCSDNCTYNFYLKNNWSMIRDKKLMESNFTCCKCGFHIEVKKNRDGRYCSDYWDVSPQFVGDHIIPICLGGGEFDADNVQILCKKCNKKKTKRDMEKFRIKMHECMLGPEWVAFWENIDQTTILSYLGQKVAVNIC